MPRVRRAKARSFFALLGIALPAAVLISCTSPSSQTNMQVRPHVPSAGETRAEIHLNGAKRYGMPELYAFLKPFPKGADLHMHLSGAVYAETFIAEAIRQGLCVTSVDAGKPASPIGNDAVQFTSPSSGTSFTTFPTTNGERTCSSAPPACRRTVC